MICSWRNLIYLHIRSYSHRGHARHIKHLFIIKYIKEDTKNDHGENKFICKARGNLFEELYLQDVGKSILPRNTFKETQVTVHAGYLLRGM